MDERNYGNWSWHSVEENEEEFYRNLPGSFDHHFWFSEYGQRSNYFTLVEKEAGKEPCMVGALPFPGEKQGESAEFHFIIKEDKLVTLEGREEILHLVSNKNMHGSLGKCDRAVDGLLYMISQVLNSYLKTLYPTIKHMKLLHGRIMRDTTTDHFSQLLDFQHKIVTWHNTLEPVNEVLLAVRELEGQSITDSIYYQEPKARMERILMLLNQHDQENTKLLGMDDKLVQYRGNEIMKTLTVFTVLTTPITALGALWGMNFKYMPELNEKFGYLFALICIFSASAFIYIWLRKKGWTGDILDKKERD